VKKMITVALTAVFASLVVLSFTSQPKGNAEFAGRAIFLDDKPAQLMAGRAIFLDSFDGKSPAALQKTA